VSSFCGSDNDENDYEIGWREGTAVLAGMILLGSTLAEREAQRCSACGATGQDVERDLYCGDDDCDHGCPEDPATTHCIDRGACGTRQRATRCRACHKFVGSEAYRAPLWQLVFCDRACAETWAREAGHLK
jgi:hypothetical protein